jgi:photosystem II stability/assembly factor-like uncharacterized protein
VAFRAGGNTWAGIGVDNSGNSPHSDHHAFAFDPQGRLLDGNDGGLFRYNPGAGAVGTGTWDDLNAKPGGNALNTIQFYSVSISPANPHVMLGGAQDNGTSLYTGSNGWTLTDYGDGGNVAFSPTDNTGSLAYHMLDGGVFFASTNAGQNWTQVFTPKQVSEKSDFIGTFAVAPTNGNEVIVGYNNLWISTDAGAHFSQLTTIGANGWNPATNKLINEPSQVDAIAIAQSNPNWIYAATGGYQDVTSSQIFVSSDDGKTWKEIDLPAGTGRVNQLAIDPNNDQVAYAVVNQFGGGHVFVTANGGANWTNISGNLPDVPTYSIALNTDVPAGAPNILYVGTDTGVYTSLDGGAHWATLSTGLPNVQVDSLQYSSRFHVLVAGTHGRGAWEVTTLSPFLAGVPGDGTPQTFVQNLYRELLGREPDPVGENAWSAFLADHNNSVGQYVVVQSFMNSAEYKTHYVTAVYQIYLDRMPDPAGLQYWTDKMGNPGTPGQNGGSGDEKYIVAAFMGSDEFYVKAGNTPQAWINAVYEDVFNRPAEAAGMAYWTNDAFIRALGGRDGIVRLLLTSPEAAHDLLDAFYPLPGGTPTTPLAAPGTTAGTGGTPFELLTGGGWENLYLEGPYGPFPEAYDGFWASLAGGGNWDDIQLLLLSTPQAYNNPNRPITQ